MEEALIDRYIEDNPGKPLVETELMTKVDANDDFVHDQILKIINHTNAKVLVDFYSPGSWDFIHGALFNAAFCLIKANAHKRNYDSILPEQRAWAVDRIASMQSRVDSQVFSWELAIELEGTLTQLKSALDSMAKAIGKFYGFHAEGFNKKKDKSGVQYSGQALINELNNLPKEKRASAVVMVQLIEDHKELLSKFIQTRDIFVHPERPFSESLSGFYYFKDKDELRDPIVGHGKNPISSYYQEQYIRESIEMFSVFISDAVVCMLSGVAPGIALKVNEKSKNRYSWE